MQVGLLHLLAAVQGEIGVGNAEKMTGYLSVRQVDSALIYAWSPTVHSSDVMRCYGEVVKLVVLYEQSRLRDSQVNRR